MTKDLNITKIFRILLGLGIVALLIYLSYLLINIIILVMISILISYILKPFVKQLIQLKVEKPIAVFIVILGAFVVVFFLLYYFIPQITTQLDSLISLLREMKLQDKLSKFERSIERAFPFIKAKDLSNNIDLMFHNTIQNIINEFSNILGSLFSIIFIAFLIPFISFFILKDGKQLKIGIINMLPNKYFEAAYYVIQEVDNILGKFVRGWLLDALFVGATATIGLYIIGIENFLMIGVIAGLGHLIPYFGPIIGGIPAVLVSLYKTGDFSQVPEIVILFTIIYIIDNGFVQPYVFSKNINMHPVVIIILIAIGNELFGIVGMFLAIPVSNIIRVTATEIYQSYRKFKIIRS